MGLGAGLIKAMDLRKLHRMLTSVTVFAMHG